MRKLLIGLVVLALVVGVCASAAFALVDIPWQGAINVQLTIPAYTQIWFQDDNLTTPPAGPDANEPDIIFSPTQGTDYYASTLIGTYSPTDGTSGTAQDAWAYGYFESKDGATIWMQSNTNCSATIVTSGDLTGTSTTIPTWFTIAVTGYDPTISGPDLNGFRLSNSGSSTGWVADGVIPFASMGGYGGTGLDGGISVNVAGPIGFGNQDFWGNQDAFRMTAATVAPGFGISMIAPVGPGTMKFVARCLRSGVGDIADNYTATITPFFTVP